MSTIADVMVCMPWRATPDRIPAFERCTRYWRGRGFPVVLGDSDPGKQFNRSAARNNAVHQSDSKVLVLADADVLPADIRHIRRAIALAGRGQAVTPYHRYRLLPASAVNQCDLAGVEPIREYPAKFRPCGITVIARTAYEQVGGYDELFGSGWCCEDAAFWLACETLIGVQQFPGVLYAFDHDSIRRRDPRNLRRLWWYQRAKGDVEQMRRLTKRP